MFDMIRTLLGAESPFWETPSRRWRRAWAAGSRCPHLSRAVAEVTSRGPVQPQPFCDSVIL